MSETAEGAIESGLGPGSALSAEGYYHMIYCFDHPEEERRTNALIADVDYDSYPPIEPWTEENKRQRLTSILRVMVWSAARELDLSGPDDEDLYALRQYCLEKWQEGKEKASDLIDEYPELDGLQCPFNSALTFQKICDQIHGSPRRSLTLGSLILTN